MIALGLRVIRGCSDGPLYKLGVRGPQVRSHFYSFDAVHKATT